MLTIWSKKASYRALPVLNRPYTAVVWGCNTVLNLRCGYSTKHEFFRRKRTYFAVYSLRLQLINNHAHIVWKKGKNMKYDYSVEKEFNLFWLHIDAYWTKTRAENGRARWRERFPRMRCEKLGALRRRAPHMFSVYAGNFRYIYFFLLILVWRAHVTIHWEVDDEYITNGKVDW